MCALALLAEHYIVTGSDRALPFLGRYRRLRPDADLLQLDAVTLETDRRFAGLIGSGAGGSVEKSGRRFVKKIKSMKTRKQYMFIYVHVYNLHVGLVYKTIVKLRFLQHYGDQSFWLNY